MDIAAVFDWFAQESLHAADQTAEPNQRAAFLKLAALWSDAAKISREPHHPSNDPLTRLA